MDQYRLSRVLLVICVALCFGWLNAFGQLPPEVAKMGYADTLFVNGKIVSMDDASTSTEVGNVYQAIAVKGDKIMKLGSNSEVRLMAGPETKIFDLQGRTLLPAIVEPHSHIFGEITDYLDRFGFKYPPNGIIVTRTADRDLEKTQALMREAIVDAVRKVEPGEWVVLNLRGHPEAPADVGFWGTQRRLTTRRTLDMWAPENPVLLNPGLRGSINSKALEILNEFLPGYSPPFRRPCTGTSSGKTLPRSAGWEPENET